jgi:hypothetical protein
MCDIITTIMGDMEKFDSEGDNYDKIQAFLAENGDKFENEFDPANEHKLE